MEKINFEDLPSKDVPIDSTNLNLLQTNVENSINGTSLFEGSTNEDVTLSDNVTNYNYIEVTLERNGLFKIIKINPSNAKFNGIFQFNASTSVIQLTAASYTISQNKITKSEESYINFNSNGSFSLSTNNNQITITKVVGYK